MGDNIKYSIFTVQHIKGLMIVMILIIAVFFRFWQLGSVPPSPSLDEVSIGWNAYSLLETGKDEYGTSYPILLRAYDDWRPAVYVYLVMPFVSLFGLSAVSVRLPSVILSVISVYAVYLFTKKIMWSVNSNYAEHTALLASFILAISPWHIYISRLGHEANAGLAFLIFAISFYAYKRLGWSVLFFALSFMSYQPQKIIIPIVVIMLLFTSQKYFIKNMKKTILLFLLGIVITLPFIISSLSPEASIRFKATNIFSSEVERFNIAADQFVQAKLSRNIFQQVLNHRYVVGLKIAASQYFSHFNIKWLILNSGSEPHKVPGLGILYWWELTGLVVGIVYMFRSSIKREYKILLITLLVTAPISASITTGAPHAMRSYTAIPAVQILAGIGIYQIILKFNKKITMIMIGSIVIFISLYQLYNGYFLRFPKEQSDSFQYAYTQSTQYIQENKSNYDAVVVSNEGNLYQSYMFYLFHTIYSPSEYIVSGGTVSGGYAQQHAIDTIKFRPIDWKKDQYLQNTLFIGNNTDFPEDIGVLDEFVNTNNIVKVVSYAQ